MNIDSVTVPVETVGAKVHIDARRTARNRRRNGATMKAAARLAAYKLRTFTRTNALATVTDTTTITVRNDFALDEADVVADVRTVRRPDGITTSLRIPPGTTTVRFAVPTDNVNAAGQQG